MRTPIIFLLSMLCMGLAVSVDQKPLVNATTPADLAAADTLIIPHSSTLTGDQIGTTITNTVTGALTANKANSAFSVFSVLAPTSATGTPSYFEASHGEVVVAAATTNYLANSYLYAGKFIARVDSAATSGNVAGLIVGLESELSFTTTNTSGQTVYPTVYGLFLANEPWTHTGGTGTAKVADYKAIYIKALQEGAGFTIDNRWYMYQEDTNSNGGNYFGAPNMVIGAAPVVAGGVSHRGAGGVRNEQASTQDGVRILGRAGGTGSYTNTVTTSALTAVRTTTLPDKDLTIASITTKGAVTQITSRTTSVTCNAIAGDITLVSAAGSGTWNGITVNNTSVAAGDIVTCVQRSGTDGYIIGVTNISANSFKINYADVTGSTTEQPVFTFVVTKFTAN